MERSKKVADVMSVNPVRVKETEFATKARALFRSYRYRSMPVVDEENKVVGVITRGDIIEVTSTKSNVLVSGLMSTPRLVLTPEEDLRSAARKMIDAGLPVALASDFNPGSAPSGNMQFILSMGSIAYKMLPEEGINATTINGAYAMGLSEELGSIAIGKKANVFITKEIPTYEYMPYSFGDNKVEIVILNGKIIEL